MSQLVRTIRGQLTKQAFPEGNPLELIGVSAQILELDLTDDELYEYITNDVARRLVMRFHPDRLASQGRARPEIPALQQRFTAAYEQLQDRELFNRALEEFRQKRSEARSDYQLMRRALANMYEQVRVTQERNNKLVQLNSPRNQTYNSAIAGFFNRAQLEALKIAATRDPQNPTEIMSIEEPTGAIMLNFQVSPGQGLPKKDSLKLYKDIYNRLLIRAKNLKIEPWNYEIGSVRNAGLDELQRDLLEEWFTLETRMRRGQVDCRRLIDVIGPTMEGQRWYPQICWNSHEGFIHYGFPLMKGGPILAGDWRNNIIGRPANSPEADVIREKFQLALTSLYENYLKFTPYIRELYIWVSYVPLTRGYFVEKYGPYNNTERRITGSIFLSDLDPEICREGQLSPEALLGVSHPVLIEGQYCVTQAVGAIRISRHSDPRHRLQLIYDRLRRSRQVSFQVRQIVLHLY